MSEESKNDDSSERAMESTIMFCDRVIKDLLARRMGKDVDKHWGAKVVPDIGSSLQLKYNDGKTYDIKLGVVPKDYMLDISVFNGDPKVLESLSFLVNACLAYYNI